MAWKFFEQVSQGLQARAAKAEAEKAQQEAQYTDYREVVEKKRDRVREQVFRPEGAYWSELPHGFSLMDVEVVDGEQTSESRIVGLTKAADSVRIELGRGTRLEVALIENPQQPVAEYVHDAGRGVVQERTWDLRNKGFGRPRNLVLEPATVKEGEVGKLYAGRSWPKQRTGGTKFVLQIDGYGIKPVGTPVLEDKGGRYERMVNVS